ncbi:MAG: flagellar basal body rod protein FlgB [Caldibacillus sp.]
MVLFTGTIALLEKALDYSAVKQNVIAHNIANADTPNYKAKDVQFSAYLHDALEKRIHAKQTDERHIPFQSRDPQIQITTRKNLRYHHNGNSVDIDYEMAELAKNQIYYQTMTDILSGKLRTLQTVIRGGK